MRPVPLNALPADGSLSVGLERTAVLFMTCFTEQGPPGWPSPGPQKHNTEQRSLNGCEHPKSSHLPSPLPLEAACPSPYMSHKSGIWVGR